MSIVGKDTLPPAEVPAGGIVSVHALPISGWGRQLYQFETYRHKQEGFSYSGLRSAPWLSAEIPAKPRGFYHLEILDGRVKIGNPYVQGSIQLTYDHVHQVKEKPHVDEPIPAGTQPTSISRGIFPHFGGPSLSTRKYMGHVGWQSEIQPSPFTTGRTLVTEAMSKFPIRIVNIGTPVQAAYSTSPISYRYSARRITDQNGRLIHAARLDSLKSRGFIGGAISAPTLPVDTHIDKLTA